MPGSGVRVSPQLLERSPTPSNGVHIGHVHDNATARAYDRGERLAERLKLMYWWDTQLTAAQHGGKAIVLKAEAGAYNSFAIKAEGRDPQGAACVFGAAQ